MSPASRSLLAQAIRLVADAVEHWKDDAAEPLNLAKPAKVRRSSPRRPRAPSPEVAATVTDADRVLADEFLQSKGWR
jgi:hypothetical protein